ncbi:MAG TPA: nicotinate-nucleotide adenylyltransferase, partial [bacterium]|nr:nicotinate-nucleotide adenylyltransferase [bacterium]
HLAAAVNARYALALDRVLMVVANVPWQKVGTGQGRPVAEAEDRYAVVEAAIEGLPGIEASRLEIERGGNSYTAETLEELAQQHPGAELFLVVGSDVVGELHTWRRVDDVCRLATLVAVARPGTGQGALADLPPAPWRAQVVEVPSLDVSSTDIRARVADGRPIDVLVPVPAVRQIGERGLYAT